MCSTLIGVEADARCCLRGFWVDAGLGLGRGELKPQPEPERLDLLSLVARRRARPRGDTA